MADNSSGGNDPMAGAEWVPILGPALSAQWQNHQANKIKPVRPTYKRPDEIDQNVSMWNPMANSSKLPGQSIMEDQIKSNTANGFAQATNAANSSAQLLSTIGKLNVNQNNAINDLDIAGANNRVQAMGKLGDARETLADYKNQEFDYNMNQPYEQDVMRKRALQAASAANNRAATQDVFDTFGTVIAAKNAKK